MLSMKMKMITMVINKDNIESRLGDVLSKCPGGANNGFDHNFVMANTEAPLNFVCRVSFYCHRHLHSASASASASACCWPHEPGEPPPNGSLARVLHQPAWLPVLHWQLCPNRWEVIKHYSDDAKSMKMMKSAACEEKRERYTRSTAGSASKPKSSQIRSTNQTFPGDARLTLVMMEMLIENKCFSCVVRPGEVYKHTVVYKVGAK